MRLSMCFLIATGSRMLVTLRLYQVSLSPVICIFCVAGGLGEEDEKAAGVFSSSGGI